MPTSLFLAYSSHVVETVSFHCNQHWVEMLCTVFLPLPPTLCIHSCPLHLPICAGSPLWRLCYEAVWEKNPALESQENIFFLHFLKLGQPLNLYLSLPHEEWCWHKVGAVQYRARAGMRNGNGHHTQENTPSWFCCVFYIMNPQAVPKWSVLCLLRWRKVPILLGDSSIPDHTMQQDPGAFWHHWEKMNPPF